MLFSKSLCGLFASVVVVAAFQHPSFGRPQDAFSSSDPYDALLFTPVEELNVLSTEAFTTLAHPQFPKYNVRIKQSNWCDGSVR